VLLCAILGTADTLSGDYTRNTPPIEDAVLMSLLYTTPFSLEELLDVLVQRPM